MQRLILFPIFFHKSLKTAVDPVKCNPTQKEENNIIDYINYNKRIFPIGRLDKLSEGLILLTNDGDIVNKILRCRYKNEKEYLVTVNKKISKDFLKKLENGVPILNTTTRKCKTTLINDFQFKIILTQGLNRQIRRITRYEEEYLVRENPSHPDD